MNDSAATKNVVFCKGSFMSLGGPNHILSPHRVSHLGETSLPQNSDGQDSMEMLLGIFCVSARVIGKTVWVCTVMSPALERCLSQKGL